MAHPSVAQAQAVSPTTTGVIVILTVKAGVTREQVMAVMPDEVRQTVQLYLMGRFVNGSRVPMVAEPFLAGCQGCCRGTRDHGGPTAGEAKSHGPRVHR